MYRTRHFNLSPVKSEPPPSTQWEFKRLKKTFALHCIDFIKTAQLNGC